MKSNWVKITITIIEGQTMHDFVNMDNVNSVEFNPDRTLIRFLSGNTHEYSRKTNDAWEKLTDYLIGGGR